MKENFNVTGMSCAACSARVEKAVAALPEVRSVNVNLLKNSMVVDFDESKLTAGDIEKTVENAGYGASLVNQGQSSSKENKDPDQQAQQEIKSMQFRLVVSIIFAAVLMCIAMAPMMNLPLPNWLGDPKNSAINALTQLLLSIPVIAVNFKFFRVGFKALWQRSPNMDSLVAIGSSASFLFGLFALYQMLFAQVSGDEHAFMHYAHNLYFDSAAMILALITLGKYFEARAKGKTTDAISKLVSLVPETATLRVDGADKEVEVSEVKVGDTLVIKTGQRVPVDGVVVEGNASIDESSLTGESIPVQKDPGSEVWASTLVNQGHFLMKVTKVGTDTALGQIIKLVDEATSSKAPVERLADKVSGIFVPFVILIAIVSAVAWMLFGYSWEFALTIAVSVLVISCPCALGLATPTAIMVGSGKGAENGILFKSAEAIEQSEKIDAVVLDKTGTVTEGRPVVTDVISCSSLSPEQIIQLAASVESKSEHPLASAIIEVAKNLNLPLKDAAAFVQQFGYVAGKIDGKEVKIGSSALINSKDKDLLKLSEELADQAKTALVVLVDGVVSGIIAVSDPIKSDSAQAIEYLKQKGEEVWMLTGDNGRTAEAVAKKVGITNVVAEAKPADKEALIKRLQSEGKKVMMVGDGINDAPSLARANVGVAIGAGTDVAIESADVVLMKSCLSDVVNAQSLSHRTMNNIRQNLFWAFIYNIIGIPIAAGVFYSWLGWTLNPMIAAAAMSLSSVSVVSNALRLRSFKPVLKAGKSQAESEFIKPKFSQIATAAAASEPRKSYEYTLNVDGMSCSHCSSAVKKALTAVKGVDDAEVSLEEGKAVVYSSTPLDINQLVSAVENAGYKASVRDTQPQNFVYNLSVEGMMCNHCVNSVTKILKSFDGVLDAEVSLEDKKASVKADRELDVNKLIQAIEEDGYKAKEIGN